MPICEKALLCSALPGFWAASVGLPQAVSAGRTAASPELFGLYSGCLSRILSQRDTASAWFEDDLPFICHYYFVSLLKTKARLQWVLGPSPEGQSRPLREIISRETSKELW